MLVQQPPEEGSCNMAGCKLEVTTAQVNCRAR